MKMMWGSICFCAVLLVLGCEEQLSSSFDPQTSPQADVTKSESTPSTSPTEPCTEDSSRCEPGQWEKETTFTFIAPVPSEASHDDPNRVYPLCSVTDNSDSLLLVRVHRPLERVNACEGKDKPLNRFLYYEAEVERLLHLGGPPVPLRFSLRRFGGGNTALEVGSDFIVGVREFPEGFYSSGAVYKVFPTCQCE